MKKAIILLSALAVSIANAQESDSTKTKLIEEVKIEANRFMNKTSESVSKIPLKNIENPQVYSIIPNLILKKQITMTLEDAMRNATGVSKLWDASGRIGGGSIFTSRGFPTTTKVRNGMGNIVNTNIDMANIERVEVIKGPSATLFGSIVSSYGGLINRVTKKPHFTNNNTADFSIGSYGFYRASADVNSILNKQGTMMARFNIAGQNQNSWQDFGFMRSYIFAPSFTYKPNDRLTFNLEAEIVGSKGNSNGGNFVFLLAPSVINANIEGALKSQGLDNATISAIMSQAPKSFKEAYGSDRVDEFKVNYDRSYNSNDLFSTTQSNSLFAEADYKINSNWISKSLLSYNQSNSSGYMPYQYLFPNYVLNFIKSLPSGSPSFGNNGHDFLGRMVWKPVGTNNSIDIQQNFISDYLWGNIRNRSVLGLNYSRFNEFTTYQRFTGSVYGALPLEDLFDIVPSHGEVNNYRDFNFDKVVNAFATKPGAILEYGSDNSVYSAYVNNVTNISDYIILSGGLRLDHFTAKGKYNSKSGVYDNGYNQTKLSPRLGLIVMPVKDKVSLFANYQNGFTNKSGVTGDGKPLVPENANQWEVGVKTSLLNDKLSTTFSFYDIKVNQIVRSDAANPFFNIQDGTQRSRGFEAEVFTNPLEGWILLAGYGYNDSKFENANADVQGLRPQASGPKHSLNFWTNYTFTQSNLKGVGIGFSANYASEAYAHNQNPDGALILPSYVLLGSTISYDASSYRFAIKVNNLTNEKYWTGWTNFIPQMPRQVMASIAYKF